MHKIILKVLEEKPTVNIYLYFIVVLVCYCTVFMWLGHVFVGVTLVLPCLPLYKEKWWSNAFTQQGQHYLLLRWCASHAWIQKFQNKIYAFMRSRTNKQRKKNSWCTITQLEYEMSFHYSGTMEIHLCSTWLNAKIA